MKPNIKPRFFCCCCAAGLNGGPKSEATACRRAWANYNIIKKLSNWNCNEKGRSEETQTLRAGCSKAEPKKIRPATDPLPGGAGRPKFKLAGDGYYLTYRPSLVSINARNFELSW